MSQWFLTACLGLSLAATCLAQPKPNPREEKVKNDREKFTSEGYWIYNDIPKGFAEAKATGKPMIVVLRCIPCVECVKLDDDAVSNDPRVKGLLDSFVRVRQVSTNGLDLGVFQFDTDQSYAVFFLEGDGTVLGRYGTRSHRTQWSDDVSVESLAEAMKAALTIRQRPAEFKKFLADKRGPAPLFPSPDKFPSLAGKYGPEIAKAEGQVVRSCIHCHQIGDAIKDYHRKQEGRIPEEVFFPFPHPKSQGLILDPKQCATVLDVVQGSSAMNAGLKKGDRISTLNGQIPVSIADVQWVLNQIPATGGAVKLNIIRDGKGMNLAWELGSGWRRKDDISWRASTWSLRRMGFGGMILKPIEPEERKKLGLETGMALRAEHVGEFGEHALAKKNGFKKGDIFVSFDGKEDWTGEGDILLHAVNDFKPGSGIPATILRDGRKLELKVPTQE